MYITDLLKVFGLFQNILGKNEENSCQKKEFKLYNKETYSFNIGFDGKLYFPDIGNNEFCIDTKTEVSHFDNKDYDYYSEEDRKNHDIMELIKNALQNFRKVTINRKLHSISPKYKNIFIIYVLVI